MTRTNIEIDDVLVDRAMRLYRLRSKREAVDLALRRLVGEPMSRVEALATEGTMAAVRAAADRTLRAVNRPMSTSPHIEANNPALRTARCKRR